MTGDGQRTWDVRIDDQTKNEKKKFQNLFIHFFIFFPLSLVSKCPILMISLSRFVSFFLSFRLNTNKQRNGENKFFFYFLFQNLESSGRSVILPISLKESEKKNLKNNLTCVRASKIAARCKLFANIEQFFDHINQMITITDDTKLPTKFFIGRKRSFNCHCIIIIIISFEIFPTTLTFSFSCI